MTESFESYTYDWLTFSRVEPVEILSSLDFVDHKLKDKGNGLLNWYQVTGGHSEEILKYGLTTLSDISISRLDVTLDLVLDDSTIECIFDKHSNLIKHLSFKKFIDGDINRTIYYGSGDLVLRIYEKGKQLKMHSFGLENWIRFEFQLKGRKVRNGSLSLVDAEVDFKSLATKYIKPELLEYFTDEYTLKSKDRLPLHNYYHFEKNVYPYLANRIDDKYIIEKLKKLIAFADSFAKK